MSIRAGGSHDDRLDKQTDGFPKSQVKVRATPEGDTDPLQTNDKNSFLSKDFGVVVVICAASVLSYAIQKVPKELCESQAPRITASTHTNIFNRCSRDLPDGTVLVWNGYAQHEKDIAVGVARRLQ